MNDKISKKFILWLVLSILWTLFIFSFSMQTGEESAELSGGIVSRLIESFFGAGFAYASALEHLIRKTAHFSEYFVLGVLLSATVRETRCKRQVLVPWFIGTLVAACDETIQLFSNGRSAQVTDVMLDSAGVFCGCLIFSFLYNKVLNYIKSK
ncbi:MAG: VanZ family protein [Agathobacter sp.]|nr:VanZ family protein [Agathobacter sp.]